MMKSQVSRSHSMMETLRHSTAGREQNIHTQCGNEAEGRYSGVDWDAKLVVQMPSNNADRDVGYMFIWHFRVLFQSAFCMLCTAFQSAISIALSSPISVPMGVSPRD